MKDDKKYDVLFYVAYPYYYPHFLPISRVLNEQNFKVKYILSNKQNNALMEKIALNENLNYAFGEELLYEIDAKVIFFANVFHDAQNLKAKTIFLCHGTGTKQCGFQMALEVNDIVLVEGRYRFEQFTQKFPQFKTKLRQVGYSKLDTIINISTDEKKELYSLYHLDPNKKTILYAPTFFPSSIEKMSDSFPDDFKDFNIVVKPHYISLERKRYRKQQKKFATWSKYKNCHVMGAEAYNLVPFLTIADIMISDESAAIFEFSSLNKPVIINRFLKLRWSYYLNPKKLLTRMDKDIDSYRNIGATPATYKAMVQAVHQEIKNPKKYEQERLLKSADICGKIDGKVSQRIITIIKEISA